MLQAILILAVIASGAFGPRWSGSAAGPRVVIGVVLVSGGAVLAGAASRTLGSSLTPLPYPSADGSFRADGVYRFVRHPIYGGVLMLGLGAALLTSPMALAPVGLLALLFEGKRVREEAWLLDRYPEYDDYRERVRRRFLPFVW